MVWRPRPAATADHRGVPPSRLHACRDVAVPRRHTGRQPPSLRRRDQPPRPSPVAELAALFVRTPASILAKQVGLSTEIGPNARAHSDGSPTGRRGRLGPGPARLRRRSGRVWGGGVRLWGGQSPTPGCRGHGGCGPPSGRTPAPAAAPGSATGRRGVRRWLAVVEQPPLVALQHGPRHLHGSCDTAFGQPVDQRRQLTAAVVDRARRVTVRAHPVAELLHQPRPARHVDGIAGDDTGGVLPRRPINPPSRFRLRLRPARGRCREQRRLPFPSMTAGL